MASVEGSPTESARARTAAFPFPVDDPCPHRKRAERSRERRHVVHLIRKCAAPGTHVAPPRRASSGMPALVTAPVGVCRGAFPSPARDPRGSGEWAPLESQPTTSFTGALTSGSTSCPIRSLAIAVPAAPAPLNHHRHIPGSLPINPGGVDQRRQQCDGGALLVLMKHRNSQILHVERS